MLRTERLILRPWTDADLAPFAELNADPIVVRHLPGVLTRAQSDTFAEGIRTRMARDAGMGLWAVEVVGGAPFIGFVGLSHVEFAAPFAPATEIGWRIASAHHNLGYATEGARAALDYAFSQRGLPEVVSFTVVDNAPSRRVMEKLGMHRDPAEDFDHPKLPDGHPLQRHVLYRLSAGEPR